MNIVLDLLIVGIVAFLVIGGYKKGLLQTVVNLGSALVASILSSITASFLSIHVYNGFVKQGIIDAVKSAMPQSTNPAEIAKGLFDQLPEYAKNGLNMVGLDSNALAREIKASNLNVPELVENLIRPVAVRLVTVILSVILFIIILTIIAIMTKTITSVVDTAGLGGANKAAGAVLGLFQALVLIMVITLIIYFMTVMLPADMAKGLRDAIDETYLYKGIYYINIPEKIMAAFSI